MNQIEIVLTRIRSDPSDQLAWREFYLHFRRIIVALFAAFGVREAADRDDLASEVFFRFLVYCQWREDWSQLPARAELSAYFRAIAMNVARNAFLARKREELIDRSADLESVPAEPPRDDATRAALKTLKSEEREFLLAFYAEGLSITELATRHGLTYTAAGTRLHRIRRKLRGELAKLGDVKNHG